MLQEVPAEFLNVKKYPFVQNLFDMYQIFHQDPKNTIKAGTAILVKISGNVAVGGDPTYIYGDESIGGANKGAAILPVTM